MNPRPRAEAWLHRLTTPGAACLVLLGFWLAVLASLRHQSLTFDEPGQAAAGYTYWHRGDYRLDPENGNLPQRWMALGMLGYPFPAAEGEDWNGSQVWPIADRWFHRMGNDLGGMLLRGRALSALLAVALGALVWFWARRLNGPLAGLIALGLFVLNPTILANAGLMTSDTASALFFLAAVLSFWGATFRLSAVRVLGSGLLMGCLFLAKPSAGLIVPMVAALAAIRVFWGPPLSLPWVRSKSLDSRASRALALAAAGAVQALIALLTIWAAYGFRYSAFAPDSAPQARFERSWEEMLAPAPAAGHPGATTLAAGLLTTLKQHRVLPEAFLYGQAHAFKYVGMRSAFLNGQFSLTGWPTFFPYTFLVKTPLACFGIMALAVIAVLSNRLEGSRSGTLRAFRRFGFDAAPLLILLLVYCAAAGFSSLNIGHRHLLAIYPPLFILCGAATALLQSKARWILGALFAALALETAFTFPHYLSYFNALAGGPSNGYRHLVDSSLDWGQDLPDLKRYLDVHPSREPVYLAYFGTASPASYGISARLLFGYPGFDVPPDVQLLEFPESQAQAQLDAFFAHHPDYDFAGGAKSPNGQVGAMVIRSAAALRLEPGTYCVSASLLQPVMYDWTGPLGPWNRRYEATYQSLYAAVRPLLSDDAGVRAAALTLRRPTQWRLILAYFEMYRLGRLTAWLRQREPAGNVGFSILIYPLSSADLSAALDGPPPELGPDELRQAGYEPPALPFSL